MGRARHSGWFRPNGAASSAGSFKRRGQRSISGLPRTGRGLPPSVRNRFAGRPCHDAGDRRRDEGHRGLSRPPANQSISAG